MPFVAAPNIVQVEVRALNDGQKIENRFTINALTTVTPAIVEAITEAVDLWAVASYFPLLPSSVQYVESFGKDLSAIDGSQFSVSPIVPTFGGQAAAPAPNETSFCISLRSTSSGRSARGRYFVLALPKDLIAQNTINATLRSQLVASGEELRSAIASNGWDWSIVSYRSGGVPRPGGPVYYVVSSVISVDAIVDSQRRRKPGNGS